MKMKIQTSLLVLAAWPLLACAHSCPYDWNIRFSKQNTFRATNLVDFAEQFNAAVREETKGAVTNAIVVDLKAATFRRQPEESPFAEQMNDLIQRHFEITAPLIEKGAEGYDLGPVAEVFPSKFPVACILSGIIAAKGMGYNETKDGAIVTRRHHKFECHAYRISNALLELVAERQRAGKIHRDFKPIPVVFAQESGMKWTLMVPSGPRSASGEFILDAVTDYLPQEKVMLVIETPKGHERLVETLKEKKYWEEWSTTTKSTLSPEAAPSAPPAER